MSSSGESTSVEEWFAQVQGTMDAVVQACTALIATHPEKEKVLALLLALKNHAAAEPNDSPVKQSYKRGIQQAVSTISKGIETAQLADEIRGLKGSTGSH